MDVLGALTFRIRYDFRTQTNVGDTRRDETDSRDRRVFEESCERAGTS